jgi:hypothetical protein
MRKLGVETQAELVYKMSAFALAQHQASIETD